MMVDVRTNTKNDIVGRSHLFRIVAVRLERRLQVFQHLFVDD
jgi:hypothetical protein